MPSTYLLLPLLLPFFLIQSTLGCSSLSSLTQSDPRVQLGGDISVDSLSPLFRLPSPFGQVKISYSTDLNCESFDTVSSSSCRWHNEWSFSSHPSVLPWAKMIGRWDISKGKTIFGTQEAPDGSFLMTGSPRVLPSSHSSILASDPIQCQEGDGFVQFRYWSSPMVKIRVCTRQPSMGRRFDWCSEDITVGDPGPAKVIVPGSIHYTFEIVIEAYNFVLSAFGQEGGVAIIDDLIYYSSAVYNCRAIPHVEPPPIFPPSLCSAFSCGSMSNSSCLSSLGDNWLLSNTSSSSFHLGIRHQLHGNYAYSRGPSTSSLIFPSFSLPSHILLEFCVYSPSETGVLTIFSTMEESENRSELFRLSSSTGHNWMCNSLPLEKGKYKWIEFSVDGLENEWNVMGIDEIALINPLTHQPICRR